MRSFFRYAPNHGTGDTENALKLGFSPINMKLSKLGSDCKWMVGIFGPRVVVRDFSAKSLATVLY